MANQNTTDQNSTDPNSTDFSLTDQKEGDQKYFQRFMIDQSPSFVPN